MNYTLSCYLQLIPVDASLRTLNPSTDASYDEDDDDQPSEISTINVDSDTDSENEYIIAPNSEEIGDQDNVEELHDFNFLERMIRFFRNANAVTNTNQGCGDHSGIDSDEDEDDFNEDNNDDDDAINDAVINVVYDDLNDDFNDDNNNQNNAHFNDDNSIVNDDDDVNF